MVFGAAAALRLEQAVANAVNIAGIKRFMFTSAFGAS
jgi:hypothetical protein